MKKVALVMESWMRYFTYAWPSGILQKIRESDLDANLYIFNSSANWSDDAAYNQGEYNIFRLPDLREFDGIVLDVNNIADTDVRDALIQRVRESGVPAVVIANWFQGLYAAAVDNYGAMQDVMEHLHGHHGCRSFWFIMGPEGNYENRRRLKSVRDYMNVHQIEEAQYYFGDFGCECGLKGFETLFARTSLPDAIVCANDNIAVGVLAAAERRGLTAPGNFLVTGFDDLDKSRYYDPRISTVSHVREKLGYAAMEMLEQIWRGEKVEEIRYTGTQTIFWDSCGCRSDIVTDLKKHLKDSILYGIETEDFEKQLLQLKYSLTYCGSVQEMLECISQCVPSLRCDGLYLVTDQRLYRSTQDVLYTEQGQESTVWTEEQFVVQGYPEDMCFALAYTRDGLGEKTRQTKVGNRIFPMFECGEPGVDFLFLPLHFREKCIGYFAIRNAVYLMEKQFLFDIINALTTALENLYAKEKLRDINEVLTVLYNHDSMTMLYNRRDLDKLGNRFLRSRHLSGETVYVVYLDLDRLKYINDQYGHKQGDFAIRTVAQMLKKYFPEPNLTFRLGGDEFLALCSGMSGTELDERCQAIQDELTRVRVENACPYELSVSCGYAAAPAGENGTLAEYVHLADDKMYACKMARRKC